MFHRTRATTVIFPKLKRPYISELRTIPPEYEPIRHPGGHATLYFKKDLDGKYVVALCVYDS